MFFSSKDVVTEEQKIQINSSFLRKVSFSRTKKNMRNKWLIRKTQKDMNFQILEWTVREMMWI
jgi:hypothetical protein